MARNFDDKILRLVLAALAGKDVEKATRQAEQSIVEAKAKLEAEEANINAMLGQHGRRGICRTARAEAAAGRALDGRRENSRWRR